ncbi:MAG TPA: tetratricopeptide repeat protein [Allosphingosinicella sp.]
MAQPDPNLLFARAEQAFVAGRLEQARSDLQAVARLIQDHPAVWHLLALVEKKSEQWEASRKAFARALALNPIDPEINTNFGNLLVQLGEFEPALAHFNRALNTAPQFANARLGKALALQRLGRRQHALAEIDLAARQDPGRANVHTARAAVLRELERLGEARQAYERALQLAPNHATALHGRARVALEQGDSDAPLHYRAALTHRPDDLELILGLAEALEAEGDDGGLRLLAEAVERHPDWVTGHEQLARMRSEAGDGRDFADHYRMSLQSSPDNRSLRLSYWKMLAAGGEAPAALDALRAARPRLVQDAELQLIEAILASKSGELELASKLFGAVGESAFLARGVHRLRTGDAAQAASYLEKAVEADSSSVEAWAYLGAVWRLLDDPRSDWLSGQEGLYGTQDLGLDEARLLDVAELLRRLHKARAHPIAQSLRGGTQTRGRLFWRTEPELADLRRSIIAAVERYCEALPPADLAHPLLRHRDSDLSFGGSWSVRLLGGGFHVSHVHPEGVLSSACYIALPDATGDARDRDGWLEIGGAPPELSAAVSPVATIEPRIGRLALFPSYFFHGTRPFAAGERLTVAFDMVCRGHP